MSLNKSWVNGRRSVSKFPAGACKMETLFSSGTFAPRFHAVAGRTIAAAGYSFEQRQQAARSPRASLEASCYLIAVMNPRSAAVS